MDILLLLLIPLALALALCGLSACRLAGRSDERQLVALAEWIATSYLADLNATAAERPAGARAADPRGADRRAAG